MDREPAGCGSHDEKPHVLKNTLEKNSGDQRSPLPSPPGPCAKTLGTELGEKGECEAIRVAAVRKGREMRQKEEGVDVSAPEFHHLRCGPALQPTPP